MSLHFQLLIYPAQLVSRRAEIINRFRSLNFSRNVYPQICCCCLFLTTSMPHDVHTFKACGEIMSVYQAASC